MKRVAVVVPVYCQTISRNDAVALGTFRRHLGRYDIVLACPESLDVSAYLEYFPSAECRRFDKRHFVSVKSYSALLETEFFYDRFMDYEYILICQLDCLVFKDELLLWCGQGYAYIGPPWADLNFIGGAKRRLFRRLPFAQRLFPSVGNGGFCLRNVGIHARLAKKYRWLRLLLPWLHEDLFWCGLVGRFERDYHIPDADTALRFGVEYLPEESFFKLGGRLPFGCHAWDRNSPDFWRGLIEAGLGSSSEDETVSP